MSKLESDTARANGAKSHGPVTPEGRARSSANSRTHGLAAKYALLPNESADEFQLLFDDYTSQFHPQAGVETELVEVMVIARLRLRRLLAIETHLFEVEISRRGKQIDREFAALSEDPRLAWVFQKLADNGQSIAMVIRYEGSINRSYDKALKQLLQLQSRRPTPPPPPSNKKLQNEPKPDEPPLNEPRPKEAVPNPESAAPRPEEAATNPKSATLQPNEPRPIRAVTKGSGLKSGIRNSATKSSEPRPLGSALPLPRPTEAVTNPESPLLPPGDSPDDVSSGSLAAPPVYTVGVSRRSHET